ncbi:MAG: sugar transferase [Candidatus Magasanikbacteria bacterium]|nr:sugar transferase [Candidatus Magasanikbacteria bacterium]
MRAVKARQTFILLGDIAILYISLVVSLFIRYGGNNFTEHFLLNVVPMSIIFVLWIIVLYVNGLYDLYNIKPSQAFLRRFTESWLISVALAVSIFYLIPFFNITPKTNLLILSAVFAVLFLSWRFISGSVGGRGANIRILAIKPSADVLELLGTLVNNPQLGYFVVGVVSDSNEHIPAHITRFPSSTPIRALVSEHNINLITVPANTDVAFSKLYSELYELLFWNVYTMPSETFFESLTGRISLNALNDSWFFENLRPNKMQLYALTHRLVDYVLATIGVLILTIITPFIGLALRWGSPGPLFYTQERVGKNGKRFRLIKFRTMHALEKDGGAELDGAQLTTINDPRITPIGRFVRKLRIDELPQVINVLRGDMSIIGPRPERPVFVAEFERHMPYYTVRHLVNPGLTGWAQINYPYVETTEDQLKKFQYDLYYVKNRSLMLDFTIVLKTLHVILYGKGR